MKEMERELRKPENVLVPILILFKRVISNEKIIIPRLDIFEQIYPSPQEHW